MENYLHLIKGAYDLHIHSGPDLLPRKIDDLEMAERIKISGMAGFSMQSHYFATGERAKIVNKLYPDCHAVGTIVLNQYVGGINPAAVEVAARSETKIVWFPTQDSSHARSDIFDSGKPLEKLPFWAKILMEMKEENKLPPSINILQDGKLIDSVYDVLDTIAKHNMMLVTGNISHPECFALVKEAHKRKVEKILIALVDHPSVNYTIEQQKELAGYGAYMEHCYNTWSSNKVDLAETINQIRTMGADRVVLSTDLGQKKNIFPDEGMLHFAAELSKAGFSHKDILKMTAHNSRNLIS